MTECSRLPEANRSKSAMLSSAFYGRRSSLALVAILGVAIIYFLSQSLFSAWATRYDLPSSPKPFVPKNVAVIIEDRPLTNLAPLILHFSSVLGAAWPIVLFAPENILPNSTSFRRAIDEGRISVRDLPPDVHFANHQAVTEFLTLPWLWEQLAPAGHVLIFQADSILCANSDKRLEDFLPYDFVGAPIDVPIDSSSGHGEGYNGGLSLRNRSMVLDIVNRFSWKTERDDGRISQAPCVTQEPCLKFEDQWFYHKMKEIPGARLPTVEVASMFVVETVWHDTPLGYHQVERWQSDKMDKIAQWCPEYQMATTDLLVTHGQSSGNEQG